MKSTAAYSQQEKDKLVADMKAKLAVIDANIEQIRVKGKDLASDAKAKWDLKMAAIDEKRKLASERIAEVEESTSKAWDGVAEGATSAWEELSKALQDASNEF
jgi:predicted phage tail protein